MPKTRSTSTTVSKTHPSTWRSRTLVQPLSPRSNAISTSVKRKRPKKEVKGEENQMETRSQLKRKLSDRERAVDGANQQSPMPGHEGEAANNHMIKKARTSDTLETASRIDIQGSGKKPQTVLVLAKKTSFNIDDDQMTESSNIAAEASGTSVTDLQTSSNLETQTRRTTGKQIDIKSASRSNEKQQTTGLKTFLEHYKLDKYYDNITGAGWNDESAVAEFLNFTEDSLNEVISIAGMGIASRDAVNFKNGIRKLKAPQAPPPSKKKKIHISTFREEVFQCLQNFPSPSSLSDYRVFRRFQDRNNNVMLNGRPAAANGPPIALFDPILAKFQDNAEGGVEPDEEDLTFVRQLAWEMTSVSFIDENKRRDKFNKLMAKYLNRIITLYTFENRYTTDGSVMFVFDKIPLAMPVLIEEFKSELGQGHGCPYIQSNSYYMAYINELKDTRVITHSRFPVILVYIAGPYIGIAFAVILDKVVFEPVTPVMPLFSLPHKRGMALQTARIFKALKIATGDLEKFYNRLLEENKDLAYPEQLKFPYVDNVAVGNTTAKLTYVKELESGSNIFRAKMEINSESLDVVVKFAQTYSEQCHKVCSDIGIAPELFAFQRLPGGWYIVIMEKLKNYNTLFSLKNDKQLSSWIIDRAENAMDLMHESGFVHGDLRLPNIMVDPKSDYIKIIDFEWAGKEFEATYPPFLNREIVWHPDVKYGEYIRKEHDLFMLRSQLQGTKGQRKSNF